MNNDKPNTHAQKSASARQDRLKATMKQNMARRKAQAKVRAGGRSRLDDEQKDKTND